MKRHGRLRPLGGRFFSVRGFGHRVATYNDLPAHVRPRPSGEPKKIFLLIHERLPQYGDRIVQAGKDVLRCDRCSQKTCLEPLCTSRCEDITKSPIDFRDLRHSPQGEGALMGCYCKVYQTFFLVWCKRGVVDCQSEGFDGACPRVQCRADLLHLGTVRLPTKNALNELEFKLFLCNKCSLFVRAFPRELLHEETSFGMAREFAHQAWIPEWRCYYRAIMPSDFDNVR